MKKQTSYLFLMVLLSSMVAGGLAQDRSQINLEIEQRTGHRLRPPDETAQARAFSLPPGVSLEEAVSEEDAVAIALWNNAELEATLAELGLARADLIEAGLLVNPDLQMLFGIGTKPFELLLSLPIQAIWQRPRRVAAAELDLESVSHGLIQNGIDLVRNVRIAHAELTLAEQQAKILAEATRLQNQIADLTKLRLKHGDINALEASLMQMEALTAADAAARAERQVGIARQRLGVLLGLRGDHPNVSAEPSQLLVETPAEERDLVEAALSSRPDLRAAEMAIEAAGRRVGWERSRVLAFIAPLLSTKGAGTSGIKSGPGVSVEIPLFNRNQGGISRAEAEVAQAVLHYLALVDQVEFEVRNSRRQLLQAQEVLKRIQGGLMPVIEETISLAEKAHANGDISYLEFQLASAPVYDVRLSEVNAAAELRQALAELERAVGRRL